ncbi:Integrase zinc binding domain [Popillia japonica]|uniref:RNA-directed DNA polymerase n=1 Tax=Popillia japonica TaxID=7064 RepID=A0AAW1KLS3_POPJA
MVINGLKVNEELKGKMKNLLLENEILYNHEVTYAKGYIHNIEITSDEPFHCKTYPVPHQYRREVQQEVQKLLREGIIERSNSCYINPIVIVKKTDGSLRICLDAREINKRIKPGYENPQTVEILTSNCYGSNIFSKLDLKSAFWLIRLHNDSKKYCAFSINGSVYQFNVAVFGVKNSPSALIRFLNRILSGYQEFCAYYFDDILIYSKTSEEHVQHLNTIFRILRENGMKINLQKCKIFQRQVKFLGYEIGREGIKLDDQRLAEIKDYPRPRKIKEMRAFLGMMNYYKRFVPNYARKTAPFKLLKKNQKWKWEEEQEEAFEKLKEAFGKSISLQHPNYGLPFTLRTDASHNAIAAELTQDQNGIEVPIQFVSRVLRDAELRYSTSEKEMLAIVYSVDKLRYYLIGKHFTIETDHIALLSLLNKRINNNRIYRWSLFLNEYDFDMKHIPGKQMITADVLSRKYTIQPSNILIANVFLQRTGICAKKRVEENQRSEEIQEIMRKLHEGTSRKKGYSVKDGMLLKQIGKSEVYVITKELATDIIRHIHNTYLHIGYRKCWLMFREAFFCKHDAKLIKEYIKTCHTCQLSKDRNKTLHNIPMSIIPERKLHIVAIDYLSNLPPSSKKYTNVLVIYDLFTKFIKLYPTQKCDTDSTLYAILQYTQEFGHPQIILSDNATYFTNPRYQDTLHDMNIKTYYTSIRHPQSNPSERAIKEVIKYLRILLGENHHLWCKHLSKIEYVINNTPSTVHEETPSVLMLGRSPPRPWKQEEIGNLQERFDAVRRRIKQKREQWEKKQKHSHTHTFKTGDQILIKTLKVTDKK